MKNTPKKYNTPTKQLMDPKPQHIGKLNSKGWCWISHPSFSHCMWPAKLKDVYLIRNVSQGIYGKNLLNKNYLIQIKIMKGMQKWWWTSLTPY